MHLQDLDQIFVGVIIGWVTFAAACGGIYLKVLDAKCCKCGCGVVVESPGAGK